MSMSERTTTATPPLESGDRLTRSEFERRYEAMPRAKKAELINQTVYMASPVRAESHGRPTNIMSTWLGVYAAATPYVHVYDNTTVRLDPDNEIQPDALLRIETESGGQSAISRDDYLEGAPELIVEVAASSASYDLHDKKTVCRRHGVREYVVWRIFDQKLDWFVLESDAYLRLEPDAGGMLHSQVFPGLHLKEPALLNGNLAAVLEAAQPGTRTEAHAGFARKLREAREAG